MLKPMISTFLITASLLSGCSTVDPYTGDRKTSQATQRGAIGAITGAVLGAVVSGGSRNGAVKGAAAGALIGAGVGHYMDQQESELRARLAETGVGIEREANNIRLIMPSNITFDVDRYDIKSDFYRTLEDVALVLREYNKTFINVYGHTDATGGAEYNQVLSEKRANAVADFLSANGINNNRLATYGYGEQYPLVTNDSIEGRATNRRVEIELQPREG